SRLFGAGVSVADARLLLARGAGAAAGGRRGEPPFQPPARAGRLPPRLRRSRHQRDVLSFSSAAAGARRPAGAPAADAQGPALRLRAARIAVEETAEVL